MIIKKDLERRPLHHACFTYSDTKNLVRETHVYHTCKVSHERDYNLVPYVTRSNLILVCDCVTYFLVIACMCIQQFIKKHNFWDTSNFCPEEYH